MITEFGSHATNHLLGWPRTRRTVGVDRLMAFTGLLYIAAGLLVIYETVRHFGRDHARATSL